MSSILPSTPRFITQSIASARSMWINFAANHTTTATIVSKVASFATNKFTLIIVGLVATERAIKANLPTHSYFTIRIDTIQEKDPKTGEPLFETTDTTTEPKMVEKKTTIFCPLKDQVKAAKVVKINYAKTAFYGVAALAAFYGAYQK